MWTPPHSIWQAAAETEQHQGTRAQVRGRGCSSLPPPQSRSNRRCPASPFRSRVPLHSLLPESSARSRPQSLLGAESVFTLGRPHFQIAGSPTGPRWPPAVLHPFSALLQILTSANSHLCRLLLPCMPPVFMLSGKVMKAFRGARRGGSNEVEGKFS